VGEGTARDSAGAGAFCLVFCKVEGPFAGLLPPSFASHKGAHLAILPLYVAEFSQFFKKVLGVLGSNPVLWQWCE